MLIWTYFIVGNAVDGSAVGVRQHCGNCTFIHVKDLNGAIRPPHQDYVYESQLGKKQIVAFICYYWTEIYVSNSSSKSGHFLCICWHWPKRLLLSLSRHVNPSVCFQAVWLRFSRHGLLHSPTTVWSCLVRSLLNNANKSCFNGFIFVKSFLFLQLWTLTFRMTDLASPNELS